MTVRLALIDGPLPLGHPALGRQVALRPGPADSPAGLHAAALAAAVLAQAPGTVLDNLVVFDGRLATDAETVAAALRQAAGATLILCAFGLARDDPAIRAEVAARRAEGALVVAAAPARGATAYPAALPGVVAVQGDARCGPAEWSVLSPGLFGACPDAGNGVRGASAAAAYVAGHLASLRDGGTDAARALAQFAAYAAFHGREHRSA